jgi:energy-coupling factor transporter transmembrane protein EcfT
VVNEVWEAATDLIADGLMFLVVLVGLFVVNPDIMADIKVGLPFVPLGFVLIAAALVVRLWHGGREVGSTAWKVVLGLLVLACLVNWFGYTFVMEAAGDEYLELHPDARHWVALAGLRSNCNPDLTMQTFLWANPALMLALGWAALRGVARTGRWASSGGARRRKARDEQEG